MPYNRFSHSSTRPNEGRIHKDDVQPPHIPPTPPLTSSLKARDSDIVSQETVVGSATDSSPKKKVYLEDL